ncbi:hypothetical protein EOM33_02505 [Candidatus Saccharibacteria bacterium]|jgi:hypothetical protein|nr:hypothetical protein [Candidatus Saccharibacteria bacterium]
MENTLVASLIYFAQAYNDGVYGGKVYQYVASESDSVGVPNTGFFQSGPEVIVPVILGVSIVIAAIVVLVRKSLRARRNKKES